MGRVFVWAEAPAPYARSTEHGAVILPEGTGHGARNAGHGAWPSNPPPAPRDW